MSSDDKAVSQSGKDSKAAARETRPANKRGLARLAAVQALYQMEMSGQTLADVILEFQMHRLGKEIDGEQYREADADWFKDLMQGMVAKQREIDPQVHHALQQDWPLKRIDSILRAILRVGVYELIRRKEVPARVIISEYVEVAKAFFSEDEPKVVNGVLDRIGREIRPGDFDPKPAN